MGAEEFSVLIGGAAADPTHGVFLSLCLCLCVRLYPYPLNVIGWLPASNPQDWQRTLYVFLILHCFRTLVEIGILKGGSAYGCARYLILGTVLSLLVIWHNRSDSTPYRSYRFFVYSSSFNAPMRRDPSWLVVSTGMSRYT